MQENLREAERRIEEARRTRAKLLDLGDLELSELPASLGDLPGLRALYLGRIRPGEYGEPKWDEKREAPGFADLSPLASLQGLHLLDLTSCSRVTDLAPIAGFRTLQSLNLWSTSVMSLTPIAELQALQSLYLKSTGVTDLAPIGGLQALHSLDLSWCAGVTDLAPFAGLQALLRLDLRRSGVMDLTPIAALPALQSLQLSYCNGVKNLASIARLQALQRLDLSWCKGVTDLAPLGQLHGLRTLDLFGCRAPVPPELLRVFAAHPCLTKLVVTKAEGVPREVLSQGLRHNCLPRLRAYLAELNLGAVVENEVKVILLGNGGAGKTQLCRRFRGEPFDDTIASTHGVQIWRKELRLSAGGEEKTFQVNWWDFGGQDIYHGTHSLFLRSRAVFLILWTPGLENRDEFEKDGNSLRNQPLAYWLTYVRSLAGKGSPVIVVQSQCDRFGDRRPDPLIPEGLGFVQCGFYSAKEDLGRGTLENQLRDAIGYLVEQNGKLQIGRRRAEVRRRLYTWRSEDQQREPAKRQHRTLTLAQFRALCDEVGDIVSWEHALDYFHQTGVVFYDWRLFANCIVLDQDWALDAVYTVFHRGRAAPFLRDSGRFTREDLAFLA